MKGYTVAFIGSAVIASMAFLTVAVVTNSWIKWHDKDVAMYSGMWKVCSIRHETSCSSFEKKVVPDWLEMTRILMVVADVGLLAASLYIIIALLKLKPIHYEMIIIFTSIAGGLNTAGTLAYLINRKKTFPFASFTFSYSFHLSWASVGADLLVLLLCAIQIIRLRNRKLDNIASQNSTPDLGNSNAGISMYIMEDDAAGVEPVHYI